MRYWKEEPLVRFHPAGRSCGPGLPDETPQPMVLRRWSWQAVDRVLLQSAWENLNEVQWFGGKVVLSECSVPETGNHVEVSRRRAKACDAAACRVDNSTDTGPPCTNRMHLLQRKHCIFTSSCPRYRMVDAALEQLSRTSDPRRHSFRRGE